jgi:uncharacterized protein YjbI with pentapeptide repeats
MANEEQLAILKQGVEVWNKWREENPYVEIDLSHTDLRKSDLEEIDLHRATLMDSNFSVSNLSKANLKDAWLPGVNFLFTNLSGTNLRNTTLTLANLIGAKLVGADLENARLEHTNLPFADLRSANFSQADLTGANISGCYFDHTNLHGAIFNQVDLGTTVFADCDFSDVVGLDTTVHRSNSVISTTTIKKLRGEIPVHFFRGCGLSDWEIESAKLYNPNLGKQEIDEILQSVLELRAERPIQISPLFISYSHADSTFVDKLENFLNGKGIRFWRDTHDMKAGRLETQIERAIHNNPTVLLILSEEALGSDWVEHEIRTARELEKNI